MKLTEILSPERVVIPLRADDLRSAADVLLGCLEASDVIAAEARAEFLEMDSLHRDAVNVGQNSFLMHMRSEQVTGIAAAIGVSDEPVARDLEKESSKEARIIMMLLASPAESSLYLQAVSSFVRLLGQSEAVDSILACKSAADLMALEELQNTALRGYLTVRDFMAAGTLSASPDMTLGEAARIMVSRRVDSLPVVSEGGEVLGMISHREVLRLILPQYVKRMKSGGFVKAAASLEDGVNPRDVPVREVMDRSVLCISEDQSLADIATIVLNKETGRFPVVREGGLVGTLSRGELVKRLFGP